MSTQISTAEIQRIVDQLKLDRFRNSTKSTYYNVWKNFNEFFIKLDSKPISWSERLTLYVGYLISKRRQSSMIRSYICAIKATLANIGVKVNEDKSLLNSLTRACKIHHDRIIQKFPIGRGIMRIIVRKTREYFTKKGQNYLATLYQALFITAYYGMFRVGELTQNSGGHAVTARDVSTGTNKNKLLFILRSSKTHTQGEHPQIVKITGLKGNTSINKNDVCPFKILGNFIKMRPRRLSNKEQFFVFRDRSPVTAANFRTVLKTIMKKAKLNFSAYSAQSFRAGRAGDLLRAGVSIETIKKLGRWRSNAVYRYLRTVF